jgi:hypothetical protein
MQPPPRPYVPEAFQQRPVWPTTQQPQIPRQYQPAYQPAYYAYPPQPPPQSPPRPPRSMSWWWAALPVAIVLLLIVPTVVLAASRTPKPHRDIRTARIPSAAAPTSSPPAGPQVVVAGADQRVAGVLKKQAAAVLADDLNGFIAPVRASDKDLRDSLSMRFRSLHTMQVKAWTEEPIATLEGAGGTFWTIDVRITYCFVVTDCLPIATSVHTRWDVSPTETHLIEFGIDTRRGPKPWEISDLRAKAGSRAIVAGSAGYEPLLDDSLKQAEEAAKLADRYAKWSEPPKRYVIFLANKEEWKQWYGFGDNEWAGAYTLRVDRNSSEVVVDAAVIRGKDMLDILRHELTHVVSLTAAPDQGDSWWLSEGLAEYVRMVGRGGGKYDDIASVRKYVQSGRWTGEVALDRPGDKDSAADVAGRYGIAYLAVQHLADKFGEAKMLAFFEAVQRKSQPLESSSQSVFGKAWADVSADCAANVRSLI